MDFKKKIKKIPVNLNNPENPGSNSLKHYKSRTIFFQYITVITDILPLKGITCPENFGSWSG